MTRLKVEVLRVEGREERAVCHDRARTRRVAESRFALLLPSYRRIEPSRYAVACCAIKVDELAPGRELRCPECGYKLAKLFVTIPIAVRRRS